MDGAFLDERRRSRAPSCVTRRLSNLHDAKPTRERDVSGAEK